MPGEGGEVHEHGAGSVGAVGDVEAGGGHGGRPFWDLGATWKQKERMGIEELTD